MVGYSEELASWLLYHGFTPSLMIRVMLGKVDMFVIKLEQSRIER